VTAVSARAATAALLAFVCFVTVRGTSMSAVAGDEPHYLVRVLVLGKSHRQEVERLQRRGGLLL
jgi:hypothetical protein